MRVDFVISLAPALMNLATAFSTDFANRLTALETQVSQLDDAIAAVKTSADAAVVRVQADVTSLKTKIDALQVQVDAGGATPQNIADLAALKVEFDALDLTNPATLPPAPTPPPTP